MMKQAIPFIAGLLVSTAGLAQFGPQQLLTRPGLHNVTAFHAGDLDGDGKTDVVAAGNDRLVFWRNLGGGAFGPIEMIDSEKNVYRSVFIVDIDGDGDQDVLCTSTVEFPYSYQEARLTPPIPPPRIEGSVLLFENRGNGIFGPRQVISDKQGACFTVYAADMDGDGDLDVLSGTANPDSYMNMDPKRVGWFENLGNRAFAEERMLGTDTVDAYSVYAADLDLDGDKDIVCVHSEAGLIVWFENRGAGVFSPVKQLSDTSDHAIQVYDTDLNGDGLPDVLMASENSTFWPWYDWGEIPLVSSIAWRENLGNGIFGPRQEIGTHTAGAKHVFAADLDGDSDQDVLVTWHSSGRIAWFENLGAGQFGPGQEINTTVLQGIQVYATDLVRDSLPEVLAISANDDKIAWYENTGSGSFGAEQLLNPELSGTELVHIADLDGDGNEDVLTTALHDHTIAWFENLGDGRFSEYRTVDADARELSTLTTADLNQDGAPDILTVSSFDNTIAWYENLGNGLFSPAQFIGWNTTGSVHIYVADMDGDSDPDVLQARVADKKITWYENTGNGQFGPPQLIDTENIATGDVIPADLDNDGDSDILLHPNEHEHIYWFENKGNGNYSAKHLIDSIFQEFFLITAADINGDGRKDVIAGFITHSASSYRHLVWYENKGAEGFSPARYIISNLGHFSSVRAADLDLDGDNDIVLAEYYRNRVLWFENQGDGTFGPMQVVTNETAGVKSIDIGHIDDDGKPDIVSASHIDHKVAWYQNLGFLSLRSSIDSTCAGAELTLPYSAVHIDLATDNEFTVQLSPGINFSGSPLTLGIFPGDSLSGEFSVELPAQLEYSRTYYLRVVSSNPPVNGAVSPIYIKGLPGFPVISGPLSVCTGADTTYQAYITESLAYHWSLPEGWEGFSTTNRVDVTSSAGSGFLSVYGENQCGTGPVDSIFIAVDTAIAPPSSFSILGPDTVCVSKPVTYRSTETDPRYTYIWTTPYTWQTETESGAVQHFITGYVSGSVSLVLKERHCYSRKYLLGVTVFRSGPDIPGLISGDPAACRGQELEYSISPVNHATYYEWSLPEGWSGTSSSSSITVIPSSNPGLIRVDAGNVCGVSGRHRYVSVKPGAYFSSEITTSFCETSPPAALTGATPEGGAYSGTGVENGLFDPAAAGIGTHWIYYAHTDGEGCTGRDSVAFTVEQCLFNAPVHSHTTMKLYPNPASSGCTIDLGKEYPHAVVALATIDGKRIGEFRFSHSRLLTVPLTDVAEGMYFATVSAGEEASVLKLLVDNTP